MLSIKLKDIIISCLIIRSLTSCGDDKSEANVLKVHEFRFVKDKKKAIDSLKVRGLYNYLDSAYWYTYVYFGACKLIRCGTVNIDSILPDLNERRVICNDLLVRRVRFIDDSSYLFITLTPLVGDSIISCDIVEGPELPHELLFDYKKKQFVRFVYEKNSSLFTDVKPMNSYELYLKRIIESEKLVPHEKFYKILLAEKMPK